MIIERYIIIVFQFLNSAVFYIRFILKPTLFTLGKHGEMMEGCYFREGDRYRSRMSLGRGELNQPCECLGRAFWAEEKARGKDFKPAISLRYVKVGAGQCDWTRVSKTEK